MKKRIWITVGAILTVGTITTLSTLVPVVQASVSSSVQKIQYSNSLYKPNYLSVTTKEALLGTKKINKGNYVFYIGSQGLEQNVKFLYNVPLSYSSELFIHALANKEEQGELNGDFWKVVNYALNSNDFSQKHVVPEFVSYVNPASSIIETQNRLLKECQDILDSAWEHRFDENLTKKQNENWNKKLKWVSSMIENGKIDNYSIPLTLDQFKTENTPGGKNGTDASVVKNPWIISEFNSLKIDYSPFSTYKNIDGKDVYYANDASSAEFRNFITFVKNRPEFNGVKDLTNSPGIIVGYRDGKLAKLFTDSFGETSSSSSSETRAVSSGLIAPQGNFYSWINEIFLKKDESKS